MNESLLSTPQIVRNVILGLLLLPWIGLLFGLSSGGVLDLSEVLWVLKNSLLQSLGGSLVALFLGLVMSTGLVWVRSSSCSFIYPWLYPSIEKLCLVPCVVPSFYVIIAAFQMVEPFPMGFLGVVFIHALLNAGLCAVLISRNVLGVLARQSQVAWVMGVSRWMHWTRVIFPSLLSPMVKLFLFVFSLTFTSFTVPLLVGGASGTTLEVLIYERLRFDGDWNSAFLLSIIQVFIILGLSWISGWRERPSSSFGFGAVPLFGSPWSLIVIIFLNSWIIFSYMGGVIDGFERLAELLEMKETLLGAFVSTLVTTLIVSLGIYVAVMAIVFVGPQTWVTKFLWGYMTPTTTLIGFGLIMLTRHFDLIRFQFLEWSRLGIGLWILFFPTLLRWGGFDILHDIERFRQQSFVLGASRSQTFFSVLRPLASQRAGLIAGLGAFWVSGEFALSGILLNSSSTLGIVTEGFISSYRLGLGTLVSLSMIVCGGLGFVFIRGVAGVLGQNSRN